MNKLRVIYDGNKITLEPFNEKDSVIVEFNNFLQSYIASYSVPFQLDIEINYIAKEIKVSCSTSTRSYTSLISDELDTDLIFLVGDVLDEEELLTPVESHICYDQKEIDRFLDDYDE